MAFEQLHYKIVKGMNQDVDIQTSSPDTAFRLFNIKNQTLDSANSNNLTNEKGNSIIPLKKEKQPSLQEQELENYEHLEDTNINGTILGIIQCTANVAVLFTYEEYIEDEKKKVRNIIYKLVYGTYKDSNDDSIKECIRVKEVAKGNFGIPLVHTVDGKDVNTEISGIFSYEHSELQKIYWVDGVNQLRYLNIADSNDKNFPITDVNKLNSSPSLKMDHHLEVERISGGGIFTSGVIQYAFTYFNKYGAETNIVDMTPLLYISEDTRGVREDETVGCSFKITIKNPDTSFDYARVYSIQRFSLNGNPVVKIVGDIKLS